MGQMVCGSCRRLLSYPLGARYIKCSSCQTVNLVLEEHQVGQVKCGNCSVLLMYPYGAPAVRCSSCNFVTEIGVHNQRPPLSVQQGQPPPPPTPIQ
ncbi:protein LOL2 isoform X2 [Telopea speciosissima]|nr:protein LOL2 isoform X2 [Telopea speciosissima]